MARSYYDVLGVEESASTAEIEAAYRERLKETHPDVTDDPDATDAVQHVIDARDVLTDEVERARYDRLGHDAYVSGDPTGSASSDDAAARTATTGRANHRSGDRRRSGGDSATDTESTGARREPSSERKRAAAADQRGARDANRRRSSGGADAGHAWANGAGGAVAQPSDPNAVRWSRLFPTGQSVVLLLAAFVCYPAFVLFSVYPPFPAVFNVVVAVCTLLLAGYLVSLPEVGVVVFGFWGLVTTGAILSGSLGVFSVPGVLAMTATWIPFGLSIVVFRLVRY